MDAEDTIVNNYLGLNEMTHTAMFPLLLANNYTCTRAILSHTTIIILNNHIIIIITLFSILHDIVLLYLARYT